ncbi:hypothetical protein PRUPE_1G005100 [Prunus persica]|uniref:Uncharacterized protein n=1 Tax=Prunus persica TaxID=3760 RepID=M5Y0S1_PRUPE|nr:hypothetical protein PRUPE_1G005100 [Prunus persica]
MKHPNPIDSESETSRPVLDARVALLKSTNHSGFLIFSYFGNPGSVNAALQQIQARSQQTTDIKSEVNMGTAQRSLPMDSSIYGQGMMQSKPGMGNAVHVSQMHHSSSQQQQDPLQPEQVQQNSCKRKGPSSSGAANSTGTGNTIGPSPNSQPSTPSTHTPGDGVSMAGNLPNARKFDAPNYLIMFIRCPCFNGYAIDKGVDDIEQFGDVGSLEDNVESFLSHDDGDGRDLFGTLKRNPAHSAEASKGFSFSEVGSIRKSSSKVVVWNMETLQTESTSEEHSLIITDVRFRPNSANSTQLATSSFDTTVRLWDAAEFIFAGHTSHVMSLDFLPKKNNLFCSCDANNEIRFWNINQCSCTRVSKRGSTQVRFQPRIGQFFAAASGNVVSIFDAESDRQTHSLQLLISTELKARCSESQGHSTEVHSLCWDTNGDYLASVRVWSLSSGECIHELSPSGNMFHSCVFHPSYSTHLVIGGYQLELWNMAENNCMTIQAHEGVISALASHDKSVKIWK